MQGYTKLDVWVKSHAVFLDICRETRQRFAEGIPTNIVEGSSTSTGDEFARHLDIALASAADTHYHLRAARDLGARSGARSEELASRVVEVRRMLQGLIERVRGG